ncbi:LacI family DNA-binding transcriptional regulator [Demequina aestuarii]|uniref:LacI family DNA-binding transcriptional regulator n=1 Tax=Demequina aestuarii TaxID=327095 RepID=UPI000781BF7D|nr:LacI family DNA-binding transcriptional regulator [Demequina aestuarii]
MATIYEVAELAGVSPATVSRVLNGKTVRPPHERSVKAAIAELGYRPSRRARSLRTKQSEMIALIIPDIENPFFTSLARGAEHVTRKAGYSLVLCNTDDSPENEVQYVETVQAEHMPGAIVAATGSGHSFTPLLDEGRPLVAVDRHIEDPRADAVMADNLAGAIEATEWHVRQGRERIACISGQPSVETARERVRGWREVVDRAGGAPDEYLIWSDYHVLGGDSAMRRLLSLPNPPDAVVVANNLMAIGALTALAQLGVSTFDIGVSVCGTLPYVISAPPGVHTVPLPAREIGERAARLLLGRIDGDTEPARTIVLDSDGADVRSREPR